VSLSSILGVSLPLLLPIPVLRVSVLKESECSVAFAFVANRCRCRLAQCVVGRCRGPPFARFGDPNSWPARDKIREPGPA